MRRYKHTLIEKAVNKYKEEILSAVVELSTGNYSDEQILRLAISSENSAISLYQQLAELTSDPDIKAVLDEITDEEKVHVGEFTYLMDRKNNWKDIEFHNQGVKEVSDLIGEE